MAAGLEGRAPNDWLETRRRSADPRPQHRDRGPGGLGSPGECETRNSWQLTFPGASPITGRCDRVTRQKHASSLGSRIRGSARGNLGSPRLGESPQELRETRTPPGSNQTLHIWKIDCLTVLSKSDFEASRPHFVPNAAAASRICCVSHPPRAGGDTKRLIFCFRVPGGRL